MPRVQSNETVENIRLARRVWDAKQEAKRATRGANAEARKQRGDKGQLAHLDALGLRAIKERAKLGRRLSVD